MLTWLLTTLATANMAQIANAVYQCPLFGYSNYGPPYGGTYCGAETAFYYYTCCEHNMYECCVNLEPWVMYVPYFLIYWEETCPTKNCQFLASDSTPLIAPTPQNFQNFEAGNSQNFEAGNFQNFEAENSQNFEAGNFQSQSAQPQNQQNSLIQNQQNPQIQNFAFLSQEIHRQTLFQIYSISIIIILLVTILCCMGFCGVCACISQRFSKD